MAQFRKKPVIINAIQFTGDAMEIVRWRSQFEGATRWIFDRDEKKDEPFILIDTLEGSMRADIGDWIIRGVKGEFYPCKPDIFDATYERVEEA